MKANLPTLAFTLSWGVALLAGHLPSGSVANPDIATDPRHAAHAAPAPWQSAVVKLRVPISHLVNTRRIHQIEDCSGTIIDSTPRRILSAWHCFDGYDDLTRPPVFRVGTNWHEARLLSSGGSMESDWAVLEADPKLLETLTALPITAPVLTTGLKITMAGFSGDSGLGADGEILTFDDNCQIDHLSQHWAYSQCAAHKGASGGPVILNSATEPSIAGVISGSHPRGTVLFVPIHRIPIR